MTLLLDLVMYLRRKQALVRSNRCLPQPHPNCIVKLGVISADPTSGWVLMFPTSCNKSLRSNLSLTTIAANCLSHDCSTILGDCLLLQKPNISAYCHASNLNIKPAQYKAISCSLSDFYKCLHAFMARRVLTKLL